MEPRFGHNGPGIYSTGWTDVSVGSPHPELTRHPLPVISLPLPCCTSFVKCKARSLGPRTSHGASSHLFIQFVIYSVYTLPTSPSSHSHSNCSQKEIIFMEASRQLCPNLLRWRSPNPRPAAHYRTTTGVKLGCASGWLACAQLSSREWWASSPPPLLPSPKSWGPVY